LKVISKFKFEASPSLLSIGENQSGLNNLTLGFAALVLFYKEFQRESSSLNDDPEVISFFFSLKNPTLTENLGGNFVLMKVFGGKI